MTGDGPRSSASVSVHVGADARAWCWTYPSSGPILSVRSGQLGVSVSPAQRSTVSDADVEFANGLARAAAQYAGECARLRATQPDSASTRKHAIGAAQPA